MANVSRGSICRRPEARPRNIKSYLDGKRHRESTGTEDREEALEVLRRRIAEAERGRLFDCAGRITLGEMHELLLENCRYQRNRTNPSRQVKRLAEMFGGLRGEDVTEQRIREYCRERLEKDGMTPGTLRRELALLKRLLRFSACRRPRVPFVDMARVESTRQGFFEEDDLQALLAHLPEHTGNLVELLCLTGWRSRKSTRRWKPRGCCA
jgi:hypothetical protein